MPINEEDINKQIYFGTRDFRGGADMSVEASRLQDGEYVMMINGRNRYGDITPIAKALNLDDYLPSGKKQGLYGYGEFLVAFVSGKAYFRRVGLSLDFKPINGFQMSSQADYIHTAAVPASILNYKRTSASGPNSTVVLTSAISSTPQALVCQDGVSQPMLIFPDGNTRPAKTFQEWMDDPTGLTDPREYVPIGLMMLYKDGKLYIVSPDGLELYPSVSGRPLDFVIAVDADGNKLNDGTLIEASRLSHRVDADPIQALVNLNTTDGSFYVSTSKASFMVLPDFQNLLFGEPQYSNIVLFGTEARNSFSVVDVLGDTALISSIGVHSFNAISHFQNEGRNAPFSAKVSGLFSSITQVNPAAVVFDNYAMFAVETVYGSGVLIFDTVLQQFTGLDLLVDDDIKMFAQTEINNEKRLFFITERSIYEYYGSEETALCQLYTKEWITDSAEIQQKLKRVRLVFQDIQEIGVVSVQAFIDRKPSSSLSLTVPQTVEAIGLPKQFPFGDSLEDSVYPITFRFYEDVIQAWKVGLLLSFDFSARLVQVEGISRTMVSRIGVEQASAAYVS